MAKVNTPLISFGARGKIARTVVFSGWKGINTVRQHVIPANPKTIAQTAARTRFAAAVAAWRTYFPETLARSAWALQASATPNHESGYNAFVSAAYRVNATWPAAPFVWQLVSGASRRLTIEGRNIDNGAASDYPMGPTIRIAYGSTITNMLEKSTGIYFIGGTAVYDILETPGSMWFVRLQLNGIPHSGIYRVTVIA